MATTFKLWWDAGMTQEFNHTGGDEIATDVNDDFTLYLGSNDALKQLQATSNPGVDSILLTPTDSDVGNGHEATEVKLATTLLGLDTAVAGAALDLGATITGGSSQTIFIRLTDGTSGGVPSTELSVQFNALTESTI